jgi:hypothetical protein
MSALICQRPSSIDRRDKRLGNGQARSRRHRIKRAVGPIRPRSFRVHANYLDALNASRVRIHRQKPKALDLKFGCGFTWHLSIKILRPCSVHFTVSATCRISFVCAQARIEAE